MSVCSTRCIAALRLSVPESAWLTSSSVERRRASRAAVEESGPERAAGIQASYISGRRNRVRTKTVVTRTRERRLYPACASWSLRPEGYEASDSYDSVVTAMLHHGFVAFTPVCERAHCTGSPHKCERFHAPAWAGGWRVACHLRVVHDASTVPSPPAPDRGDRHYRVDRRSRQPS